MGVVPGEWSTPGVLTVYVPPGVVGSEVPLPVVEKVGPGSASDAPPQTAPAVPAANEVVGVSPVVLLVIVIVAWFLLRKKK